MAQKVNLFCFHQIGIASGSDGFSEIYYKENQNTAIKIEAKTVNWRMFTRLQQSHLLWHRKYANAGSDGYFRSQFEENPISEKILEKSNLYKPIFQNHSQYALKSQLKKVKNNSKIKSF